MVGGIAMTAKVITNRSRQVAMLAKQGHKFVHLIRSTAHGLHVEKITEDELTQHWSELVGYSVETAIQRFAKQAGQPRTTREARKLLLELAADIVEEGGK